MMDCKAVLYTRLYALGVLEFAALNFITQITLVQPPLITTYVLFPVECTYHCLPFLAHENVCSL